MWKDSLRGDVDLGRLAGGILDDQEQFGNDFDDVARLEDEVPLLLAQVALK